MQISQIPAKRCLVASGWLVHEGKVLLIKHKMLGIWLAPGGHVEKNELPHHAAEREFFEETGLKVKTISAFPIFTTQDETENLPLPFIYNLHWINHPGEKKARSNGEICEQHYVFSFFVEPAAPLSDVGSYSDPDEGIDGIQWFTQKEVEHLENTSETIRQEALYVFKHHPGQIK